MQLCYINGSIVHTLLSTHAHTAEFKAYGFSCLNYVLLLAQLKAFSCAIPITLL